MAKTIDPGRIAVQEFIAHQVPRRRRSESGREPKFSQAVPDRNDRNLDFFTRRLKRTLQQRGQPVETDPRIQDALVPAQLKAYLQDGGDIVGVSQKVATHLCETQPGSHHERESLFVATRLSIAGQLGLAVMKLEEEEGVHFTTKTVRGKTVLDVELYDNLTLTDNTRVFKAGAFWIDRGGVYGLVSDDQQGQPGEIADFFLRRFLACRYQRRPSLTTKDFYEAVETWIDHSTLPDQDKLDAYDALKTEVRSQRRTIDPVQFIADNFAPEHQDALRDHLAQAGVPDAEFDKDLARLGTRPSKSRLKTSTGITITGDADDIKERVSSEILNGEQVIVIRDVLASR
jgi:hypothetical protein